MIRETQWQLGPLFLAAASLLAGQEVGDDSKKASPTVRFVNRNHPSLRIGDWGRVDFKLVFMHDFRVFDPEFSGDEGETSSLRRFRVGIEGYVHRDFEYQVEAELRNEIADAFRLRVNPTSTRWRDVYGNWRHFRRFQIRAGRQKIPFGLDQWASLQSNEFAFRSMIGERLAPGRDLGIVVHGRPLEQRLEYQFGLFKQDGLQANLADNTPGGDRTIAGRVAGAPLKFIPTPGVFKLFKGIELGGAFTESPVEEGLRSLRGRTWVVTHNYFERIYVNGQRLRLGAEFNWEPGPFSLKGEMMRVRDERLGQGIRGEDLPDLISRGWYTSASWVVTGERKAGLRPRRDFGWGRGTGAIELAARYEQIRFCSTEHPGLPSRSPRAANVLSSSERAATFGANWYLNRFMRVTYNAMREVIEDVQNAPIRGQSNYWGHYVRMQFVL